MKRLLVMLCSSMVSLSLAAQVCDVPSPVSCEICTRAAQSTIANFNTESRHEFWQSALQKGACSSASGDRSLCDKITSRMAANLEALDLQVPAGEAERLGEISVEKASQICQKMDCCSSEGQRSE